MPVLIGTIKSVQEVIDRAKAQGCVIRTSDAQIATPYGTRHIRFLHNPQNNGRFDITDYDDDEFMVESEWRAAERRLGITIQPLN